jgi:hypothetical protein
MSEDKETYGKLNCRHETTTPIINLPGMSRCDECGEVLRIYEIAHDRLEEEAE